uniref:Twinkle protein, mitochondrial (inferred by orthology to a human protein) n=1 Tax=Strongyloides venezuelensis TaxID=75913 RepID=A0A0K0FNF8_STRVS
MIPNSIRKIASLNILRYFNVTADSYSSRRNALLKYNTLTNTSCTSILKYSNTTDTHKSRFLNQEPFPVNGNSKESQQNIQKNSSDTGNKYSNSVIVSHLTATDIKNDLAKYYIPIKNSKYTNYITTTCSSCVSIYSNYIIPESNLAHCIECGAESTYNDFLKQLEVYKREFERLSNHKSPGILLSIEQLDSDLYDSVSYRDLLIEHEENFKKIEEAKKLSLKTTKKLDKKQMSKDKVNESLSRNEENYYSDPTILKIWNESHEIPDTLDYNVNLRFKLFNKYLGIDRLSPSILRKCNVRTHINKKDELALIYPRYRNSRNPTYPIGIKIIRQTVDGKLTKENYPLNENKHSGIFCHHLITEDNKEVILTTNERDAMAINEVKCSFIALSLPKGHILDYSIIPYLERFEKIYFWFPEKQQRHAKDLAIVLNIERCTLILEKNRPIELLRYGMIEDIKDVITNASKKATVNNFKSLKDLRKDVKIELENNSEKVKGFANWVRFDTLNNYLGGLRPSELTVLTGGSGYGKTTFMCEYAIDLFTQGVRTLMCSFEMNEEKIMKWMLVQYASLPLYREEHHSKIDIWLDRFEKKQFCLMFLKSSTLRDKDINEIFSILKENIIQCGIQHVVIDNLQFLIGLSTLNNERSSYIDKFILQDRFIGLLRRLATDCGIHVTLVVHPRKIPGEAKVELQDVGGSGKITQEADNVIAIVRKTHPTDPAVIRKFLVILKNRYGGRRTTAEQLEMIYQASTYTHILIDHSKVEQEDISSKAD